jgi:hypothetical protein
MNNRSDGQVADGIVITFHGLALHTFMMFQQTKLES